MAGTCFRLARGLGFRGTCVQAKISVSPIHLKSYSLASRTMQHQAPYLERDATSVLCRSFSNLSLSAPARTHCSALSQKRLSARRSACLTVPVRTVVRHSKKGKMKTVKAVAKRFRRTGSGKLKFWPPGNVHNLLSKSHNQKCRLRKPRYANKTQTKTLNKMLNGCYS